MATHSSILAWEIPWTEELDGLQSMGSQTVEHNLGAKQQQIHTYICVYIYIYIERERDTYIFSVSIFSIPIFYLYLYTMLFCPLNSPGKNIGVNCHSLLQGNF